MSQETCNHFLPTYHSRRFLFEIAALEAPGKRLMRKIRLAKILPKAVASMVWSIRPGFCQRDGCSFFRNLCTNETVQPMVAWEKISCIPKKPFNISVVGVKMRFFCLWQSTGPKEFSNHLVFILRNMSACKNRTVHFQ